MKKSDEEVKKDLEIAKSNLLKSEDSTRAAYKRPVIKVQKNDKKFNFDYLTMLQSFSDEVWAHKGNMAILRSDVHKEQLFGILRQFHDMRTKVQMTDYEFELELRETSHQYFRIVLNNHRQTDFQYPAIECFEHYCNPNRVTLYAYLMKDGTIQKPFNEDYFASGYAQNTIDFLACPRKRLIYK